MNIDSNNPNINSTTTKGGVRAHQSGVKQSTPDTPAKAQANSTSDNVSLSSQAKALGRLEQAVSDSPDVDIEKVAAFKSAIEGGNYHVDSERLAKDMLDHDDFFS